MGRFVKGDVVVVPFRIFDLGLAKRRPALVVAKLEEDDRILGHKRDGGLRQRWASTGL